MKKYVGHLLIIFIIFNIDAIKADHTAKKNQIKEENNEISECFFLPDDHEIKSNLDTIFKDHTNALDNINTLTQAGFDKILDKKYSKIKVLWHPKLKGYILKVYTNNLEASNYISKLMNRIYGAKYISEYIQQHQLSSYFDVPKKWIYKIPNIQESKKKKYIVIAEEKDLLSKKENLKAFKNRRLKREFLFSLFTILNDLGLRDSLMQSNIPFSKEGKICFIDTEYYHEWPVPFKKLTHLFAEEQQIFWKALIKKKKSFKK